MDFIRGLGARLSQKLRGFMAGRYGVDKLGWVLIISALALSVVFGGSVGIIYFAVEAYALYRMLSRNVSKRKAENDKFESALNFVTNGFFEIKDNFRAWRIKHF